MGMRNAMIPPRRTLSDRAMPARFLALALIIAGLPLAGPAAAQDAADFVVRMNRLKDQLRKFEEDIEFRFQESAGGRGGSPRLASPPAAAPPPMASQTPAMQPPRGPRRGDAFDPGAAPHAPGAPLPLGTTRPSAPLPPNVVAEVAPGPAGPLPHGAIEP